MVSFSLSLGLVKAYFCLIAFRRYKVRFGANLSRTICKKTIVCNARSLGCFPVFPCFLAINFRKPHISVSSSPPKHAPKPKLLKRLKVDVRIMLSHVRPFAFGMLKLRCERNCPLCLRLVKIVREIRLPYSLKIVDVTLDSKPRIFPNNLTASKNVIDVLLRRERHSYRHNQLNHH
jgi:hypothetical protein